MQFPKVNIIDKWLEESPNPEMVKLVEKQIQEIINNSNMIAVFCKNRQRFDNFKGYPRDNFVFISSKNDLKGRRFSGVLTYADWRSNYDLVDVFYKLKERQPELFK